MAEKNSNQPPLDYRLVFVQYVRRQKSRYNPSFSRFEQLPKLIQADVLGRWSKAHPKAKLPALTLSNRPNKGKPKGKPQI